MSSISTRFSKWFSNLCYIELSKDDEEISKKFKVEIDEWLKNNNIQADILLLCEIYTLIDLAEVHGNVNECKVLNKILDHCKEDLSNINLISERNKIKEKDFDEFHTRHVRVAKHPLYFDTDEEWIDYVISEVVQ